MRIPYRLLVMYTFVLLFVYIPHPAFAATPSQNATPVATLAPYSVQVLNTANLRSGPATTYKIVGSAKPGTLLTITGRDQKGDWLQLSDGKWIAAFLVKPVTSQASTGTSTNSLTGQTTATPQPVQAQPAPAQPAVSVILTAVNKKEEYFILRNNGTVDVNLSGWTIVSERGNQHCALSGTIAAGTNLQIWTQSSDGTPNCGYTDPILNNKESDPTSLYNPSGQQVSHYAD